MTLSTCKSAVPQSKLEQSEDSYRTLATKKLNPFNVLDSKVLHLKMMMGSLKTCCFIHIYMHIASYTRNIVYLASTPTETNYKSGHWFALCT